MKSEQLYTYKQILEVTPNTKHILLGNGFSISCNKVFQYNNIYEFAKSHGLTDKVLELFHHFGTTNFELIARALGDTLFIGELYKLIEEKQKSELKSAIKQIKDSLISAIAQTHLATPDELSEEKRLACVQFLKPYKNVFTTNYDLLLYWVSMLGIADKELSFEDGFRSSTDDPDAKYVIFSDHIGRKDGLFYLHGALHLFEQKGEVRKHCWNRSGVSITENVIQSLENDDFPLFVAEGDSTRKLETIQRSGYLSYCYQKLQRLSSTLVVCGSSLGDSDEHILRAIGDSDFSTVWLGVYGDCDSEAAKRMEIIAVKLDERRKKNKYGKALEVKFHDVRTTPIWGENSQTMAIRKHPPAAAPVPRKAKQA